MKNSSTIIEKDDIAAAYARVSTPEQARGDTIKTQITLIRNFVETNKVNFHKYFKDDGVSGELVERPGMDALFRDAELKKFNVLILTNPTRLERDRLNGLIIRKKLKKLGIKLHYLQIPNLGDTPEGELTENIFSDLAQYQRASTRRDTIERKILKALDGKLITSKPPFGYDYIRRDINRPKESQIYVINEEEARVVHLIFKMFVEDGLSIRGITRELTKLGFITKNGNKTWAKSTTARILSNPVYIGKAYYNKHARVEPVRPSKTKYRRMSKTSIKKRPKEDWIEISVPPIIDEKTFGKTQRLLQERSKHVRRSPKQTYPLSGLIFCDKCGSRLLSTPFHGVRYYRCSGRHYCGCDMKSVQAARIEDSVLRGISNLCGNTGWVLEYLQNAARNQGHEVKQYREEIKLKKTQINNIEKEEKNYYKLFGKKEYNIKILNDLVQELGEKRKRLEWKIKQSEEKIDLCCLIPEDLSISEHLIEECQKKISQNLAQLSPNDFKKLLGIIAEKLIYGGNKVIIKGNFPIFQDNFSRLLSQSSECYVLRLQQSLRRALHDADL